MTLLGVGFLLAWPDAHAQSEGVEISDAACSPALEMVWTTASDACVAGPVGYVCNGGGRPPLVEPVGPVSNALAAVGALVEAREVDLLQTAPLHVESSSGGVAWLRLGEPTPFSGLLVGHVAVLDVAPADFMPWQSMVVVTGNSAPPCGVAPQNAFLIQTAPGQTSNVVINGVSVVLDGTLVVRTREGETLFLGLAGQARILARGQEQVLRLGEQVAVPHQPGDYFAPSGPPVPPIFMDTRLIQHLPVALLDYPVLLPQPGYVTTAGLVNMRASPSTSGALLGQVAAGTVLSVLGRNPAGNWYHVRLSTGETGWMFADLLRQNVGEITSVYEATPQPPQRYGLMGQIGRVLAPAGLNIRQAPDVSFPLAFTLANGTEVTLLARSPYSPWVKIQYGDNVGWAALIALETRAIIDALPIDYDVPPPPAPTRIPGSFGNAFPDPRGGG
jgi:uncharacterized protein YraI